MATPSLNRINKMDARDRLAAPVRRRELDLGFADLTDTDTSQDFDIGAVLPAGAFILGAYVNVSVAFAGGAISAITCDIGIKAGDVDSLIDGLDLETTGLTDATIGAKPSGFYGAITPQCRVDSVGADVDAATAGAATIVIMYIDPADVDLAS